MPLILLIAAVASFFFFAYPLTAALSFFASLHLPWAAVAIGLFADLLYLFPHVGGDTGVMFPVATVVGAVLSLVAVFVRRFIRERIMDR